MRGVVVVRVGGEIGVKSRPVRRIYERKLMKIIRSSLQRDGIPFSEMSRVAGRIYIFTDCSEEVAKRVSRIFGVSSASAGLMTSADLNQVVKSGTEIAVRNFKPGTFAVKCRRIGSHAFTSTEVASMLGESILRAKRDLKVDLESPDQTLFVEIRDAHAYIYLDSIKGPGGFPAGTQDLLLGIIDDTEESVLASWCMMKRGAMLKVVTYEIKGAIPENTRNNLRRLLEWTPNACLETIIVPMSIGEEKLRSYELKIAICLAEKMGIQGVVSGLRPTKIRTLETFASRDVQVFFPIMVLEDQILDEWFKYIGIEGYRRKGDFEEYIPPEDTEISEALSRSIKIILSPEYF